MANYPEFRAQSLRDALVLTLWFAYGCAVLHPVALRWDAMEDTRYKDWRRLAQFIKTRRSNLGLTQGDLAERAGVSLGVITDLESGRSRGRFPHKLPLVEVALGWEPNSAASVLDGERPEEQGAPLTVRPISPAVRQEVLDRLEASRLRPALKDEMREWLTGLPEKR